MRITILRWVVMTISFFILIFGGYIGINLGDFLPTFSCYFIGSSKGATCFLYPLQAELGSADCEKYISIGFDFLLFSLLIIAIGRAWCGWICPLGFLLDVMDLLRRKLNIDYIRFSEGLRKGLKSVKWIFLFIMLLIPFWVAFPVLAPNVARDMRAPFCSLCPARYIQPMITGDFIRTGIDFSNPTLLILSTLGLTFSVFTIFGSFMKRRFYCHYCPMGLILGLYRRISLIKLKKDIHRCTRCEICYNVCPMEIEDVFMERVKDDVTSIDCNLCLRCIEYCPEDDALRATFLGKTIYKSSRKGFFKRDSIT